MLQRLAVTSASGRGISSNARAAVWAGLPAYSENVYRGARAPATVSHAPHYRTVSVTPHDPRADHAARRESAGSGQAAARTTTTTSG
jgi:hypothetical protein